MATLTIELPDDVCQRLVDLARYKNVKLDQLVEELSTAAINDFDRRKTIRKATNKHGGNSSDGLKDMLDDHFSEVKGMI